MRLTHAIAAIAAVTVFLAGAVSQLSAYSRDKPVKPVEVVVTDTYVVHTGDTLWSIAGEYCPEGVDKRDYIDDIVTRNRLDGAMIYAGQEIEVWKIEKDR